VTRFTQVEGYRFFSLMRASGVVNRQSAPAFAVLRLVVQAATSLIIVCLSGMRRSRHWTARTPSSAKSSQLPCLGVSWACHAIRTARRGGALRRPERPRRAKPGNGCCGCPGRARSFRRRESAVSARSLSACALVDGRAAVGRLDVAPALQRRGHHEQVGRAVSGVFIIDPRRTPVRRRLRRARLGDQLL